MTKFFIHESALLIVCVYQPLHMGRMEHKVNFQVEFNKPEFRLFLLNSLPKTKEITLPNYLPTAGGRYLSQGY